MPELSKLLRQRLAATENCPVPAHPDADTLTAYVEKSLPAAERPAVIAHLSVCAPCREVVVLSQSELPELATQTVLAPTPVSPWRRLLRPSFGLAASVAAMAIIAVLVLRLPQKSTQQSGSLSDKETQQAKATPLKDQIATPEEPKAAVPAPGASTLSESTARMDLDRNANDARAQLKREEPARAKIAATLGAVPSSAAPAPPAKVPGLTAGLQRKDFVNTGFFATNTADVVLDGQSKKDFPSAPQPQTAGAGTLFSANTKITGFSDIPANAAGNWNVRILTPNPPKEPLSYKLGQLASATVHSLHLRTNVAPNLRAGALGASTMGEPGSFSSTLLKSPTAEVKSAPEKAGAGSLAASDALSPGALSAYSYGPRESAPISWKVVSGKLIKSAGQSQWEEAYPGAGFEFSFVTARGSDVWAGGSHASIIHSRDGGVTWETVRLGEAATGTVVSIMAGTLNVQIKTSDNQCGQAPMVERAGRKISLLNFPGRASVTWACWDKRQVVLRKREFMRPLRQLFSPGRASMRFLALRLSLFTVCLIVPGQALCRDAAPLPVCGPQAGSNVACAKPPTLIDFEPARYTPDACRAELEGTVTVSLVIAKTGVITEVRVLHSLGKGLDENVVSALQQSRFVPATYQGRPVSVTGTLKVVFSHPKSYGIEWPETATGDYAAVDHAPGAMKKRLPECKNVLRKTGKLQCPRPIHVQLPRIDEARQKDLQGVLALSAIITETGSPGEIQVLHSLDPEFDELAIAAVRQWRYRPAVYKKRPYPVKARIELNVGPCKGAEVNFGRLE